LAAMGLDKQFFGHNDLHGLCKIGGVIIPMSGLYSQCVLIFGDICLTKFC